LLHKGLCLLVFLMAFLLAPPVGAAVEREAAREGITAQLRAAHFAEPLVPTRPTTQDEDQQLLQAALAYERRGDPDDFTRLTGFLFTHPESGWRVALLTNLGLSYLHYGYFSRALEAWEAAWRDGKELTELEPRALVDRAFGEVVRLHAALGHVEHLAALLDEIGDRPVSGPATEAVQISRETLWVMRNDPKHLFLCGPMALKRLMLAQHASLDDLRFLDKYRAGPNGVSLAEVAGLAEEAKLPYQMVFRGPGQPVPVPSVVHWKVGHFAAIVGAADGRFQVKDPVFGRQDLWVTPATLDAEASGYFLAPADQGRTANWRQVQTDEAERVWGMGPTTGFDMHDLGPTNGCGGGSGGGDGNTGMCGYGIREMAVGLTLMDQPVGYTPPTGPPANVTLTYNQREADQPAIFNFSNISPKWTLNWLSYIEDDPTVPGANVLRYRAGGGASIYAGYFSTTGSFAPEETDASVLVLASKSPVAYKRFLRDGGVEVYAQSDGSPTYPRRVFLTQIIDPQGNAATLAYDSRLRLNSLTDATGRRTTLSYELASSPLLITQITDPFGRSARLTYDASARLSSITDVLGLTSIFTYDASSLVNSMTTPYGTTQFAYAGTGNTRFVQVTDPLGYTEREETLQPAPVPFSDPVAPQGLIAPFNQYLNYRNSFHWDKHAYAISGCTPSGGCDYSKARVIHFHHDPSDINIEWHSIESIKYPLENRIWYNYPGQSTTSLGAALAGTYDAPTRMGRVLDNGTTQLTQRAYNGLGNLTQTIDPVGRETDFAYALNQIDLATVSQKIGSDEVTIGTYSYNGQHRPLTYTDAAGQTTTYTYNSTGQLTSATDPLHQTTTYQYDSLGRLTTIVNANGAVTASVAYDAFDRVATFTDSEGWTAGYDYDAADRMTQITYPDGTTGQYTYNGLDLVAYTDRQGRVSVYTYDADRRLVAVTDPLGSTAQFGYYENDSVYSLTDPNGHTTSWEIDIESRPTAKHYADGASVYYVYENTTSRLASVEDARGQIKHYRYAPDDRLTGISYANAINSTPNVSFGYDSYFPRVTAMIDGTGTTDYSYVPVGSPGALRLQQELGPLANSAINYTYDGLGRIDGPTVGGAGRETFEYDQIGRLIAHGNGLGQFTLNYLGQSAQLTARQLFGTKAATTWTYLPNTGDRRLAAINNRGIRQYQYTTTPEDLITGIKESTSGMPPRNWSFGYDNVNRLLTATTSIGAHYTVSYDAAGNITSSSALTATYNNVNELTSFAGRSFVYDANGNLLSDGQRSYAWDAEKRLVGITYTAQPNKQTAIAYDGLDRRTAITTTVSGAPTTTYYLWCGSRICQARNSGNTVTRSYYTEGEVMPAASARLYYGPDQLDSVRDVYATSPVFSTVQTYDYDPYGKPTQMPTSGPLTDFRYAGMFYHADSGLYLTQYRIYDPRTARWLSRDPLGEIGKPKGGTGHIHQLIGTGDLGHGPLEKSTATNLNMYTYAYNDPVNATDATGLQTMWWARDPRAWARLAAALSGLAGDPLAPNVSTTPVDPKTLYPSETPPGPAPSPNGVAPPPGGGPPPGVGLPPGGGGGAGACGGGGGAGACGGGRVGPRGIGSTRISDDPELEKQVQEILDRILKCLSGDEPTFFPPVFPCTLDPYRPGCPRYL
jgi:RHS repeat-associated protein